MSEEHHDVHPASHYWKIFWILCALFVVSVAGPEIAKVLDNKTLAKAIVLITAFGIAIVKAYLVCKHFMHLDVQKKYVLYMLGTMVAFVMLFFFAVAPDVMKHEGQNWENWSAKESVDRGLAAAEAAQDGHGGDHGGESAGDH